MVLSAMGQDAILSDAAKAAVQEEKVSRAGDLF
jgi:hypothetical protein